MKTILRLVITVVGVVAMVFGFIFIIQSVSVKQQVADSIAPLPLSQVNTTYDSVTIKQKAIMAAEEPNIQAGKAAPSAMYNYLTIQRSSLGLAKTNIGLASLILTMGIIDVLLGAGLVLVAVLIPGKDKS